MMRAKLCVPAGGSVQVKAGEVSSPLQENLIGIASPLVNAELEILNDIATSFVGCVSEDGGICAGVDGVDVHAARLTTRK
jgi:hypothetical protein